MQVKTVLIESDNGALRINESDFDKKIHTLFKAPEAPATGNASMTVAEIKDALTKLGVEFNSSMVKAELLVLLNESE